jgi:hypothetical protein
MHLDLRASTTASVQVDLAPNVRVIDQGKVRATTAIKVGAYVQADGYEEQSRNLRADRITIVHPTLSLSAVVISPGNRIMIQTSDGERYRIVVSTDTVISTGRAQVSLSAGDIPVGARLHVDGTMRSDGSLAASLLDVRLASITIDGRISRIDRVTWAIVTTSGSLTLRLSDATTISQGSHTLVSTDVVVGDEVTVAGYVGGSQTIFAHKISVHRKLMGLDGTLSALNTGGFNIKAADGEHSVLLEPSTIITGGSASDLTVGAGVHVTGYLRGDGLILATRVRLVKKKGTYDLI